LTSEVIGTVFAKLRNNLEFTGIDFKQFDLLMAGIDYIYIYGEENNGYLNQKEFLKFLGDDVLRADYLDNIDDCYVDKDEADEKDPITDHWSKQKELLGKHRRRTLMKTSTREKKTPSNEDARKAAYNIYDLNED
jgi:hypothetical protein